MFTSFGGSQCLFGSWRLISVRVLNARNDGRSLASHGASRVVQTYSKHLHASSELEFIRSVGARKYLIVVAGER